MVLRDGRARGQIRHRIAIYPAHGHPRDAAQQQEHRPRADLLAEPDIERGRGPGTHQVRGRDVARLKCLVETRHVHAQLPHRLADLLIVVESRLDLVADVAPGAGELAMAEGVRGDAVVGNRAAVRRRHPFGHDHRVGRGETARGAQAADQSLLQVFVDDIEVDRDLRQQDAVGVGGDAAAQRDVAGIAPERLGDHHAVVAAAGRLEIVDDARDPVGRGIPADRVGLQVEVDRLRRVHDRDAPFRKVDDHRAGIVAARDD